jgi:hypothetical protein
MRQITDVTWALDHRGRPVLDLRLDGHPAHIRSSQRTELIRRGLLEGMSFLDSERGSQLSNRFVTGDYAPRFTGRDLVGCTDDPQVFALYTSMCAAISSGTWRTGIPLPVA